MGDHTDFASCGGSQPFLSGIMPVSMKKGKGQQIENKRERERAGNEAPCLVF